MNDIIRDGATLEKIERDLKAHQALYGKCYFLSQSLKNVTKMLAEKTKLIEEQTKADEMTMKEYETFFQNKGFDSDVA